MGIMVRVNSVIKDKEGNIIAVRGHEMVAGQVTEERTWKAEWICNKREPNTDFIYSTHAFWVKDMYDENKESAIHCEERNNILCLVAPSENGNLLEKLPVYSPKKSNPET